jgi:hypothetical protein
MIEIDDDSGRYNSEQVVDHIKKYIDRIPRRYTKHYGEAILTEDCYM